MLSLLLLPCGSLVLLVSIRPWLLRHRLVGLVLRMCVRTGLLLHLLLAAVLGPRCPAVRFCYGRGGCHPTGRG